MNVLKLTQDILKCQEVVGDIHIKHYDQDEYREIVTLIFKDIFKEYFECPDKLEPQEKYLPEKSRKAIRAKYGLGRSEN